MSDNEPIQTRRREVDRDLAELSAEVRVIKDNHLKHIGDDISEIKQTAKDHHTHFNNRLDKVDARMWTILLMTLAGLAGTLIKIFFGG